AAWDQNVANQTWRGWWRIGNLTARPGTPVSAVARDSGKLDIFVAGADGRTYTAAWGQNLASGAWRGRGDIPTRRDQPGVGRRRRLARRWQTRHLHREHGWRDLYRGVGRERRVGRLAGLVANRRVIESSAERARSSASQKGGAAIWKASQFHRRST